MVGVQAERGGWMGSGGSRKASKLVLERWSSVLSLHRSRGAFLCRSSGPQCPDRKRTHSQREST